MVWTKESGSLPPKATEASGILTIPDVREEHSGTYVCTGSDLQSVAQDQATLIVESGDQPSAPRVRINPIFQEVNVGDQVTFKCIGEGYPPPQLHWTGGRNNILNPSSTFLNGVFHIPSVTKNDEAEYFCTATNSAGSDSIRTILYVKGQDTALGTKPHVTISPVSHEAKRGETVQFECHVTGYPVPDLSWSFSEGNIPADSRQIGGLLILSRVNELHQGLYTCTAKNAHGTTQAHARLTLESESAIPTVRVEPEKQTIIQGQSGELRCIASGVPTPTITWQKIGNELAPVKHLVVGNSLIIEKAVVEDRGLYMCRAENREGIAQGAAIVEIERREVPLVEIFPQPSQVVIRGASALFQCRVVAGIPSPTLEWRRAEGTSFTTNTEVLEGGVIRFNSVTGYEDGTYICTAENIAGRVTAEASLKIQGTPTVRILQTNPYRVQLHDKIKLECIADDPNDQNVNIVWRKYVQNYMKEAVPAEELGGQAVLVINSASASDSGIYACVATTSIGASEERINVIVEDDLTIPEIAVEERVTKVPAGGRAVIRCFVRGLHRGVELHWVRGGNLTMPSTSSSHHGTLYIDDVKPEDSGEYICTAVLEKDIILFQTKARLAVIGKFYYYLLILLLILTNLL